MQWLFRLLLALVVTVSAITLAGVAQPRYHNRSVDTDIHATRGAVWKLLADFTAQPAWRKELAQVAMQPAPGPDMQKWAEFGKDGGTVMVQTISSQAPQMLELQFYGNLSGLRRITLTETANGTHLRMDEQVEIHNPLLRVVRMFSTEQERNRALDDYVAQLKNQAEKK